MSVLDKKNKEWYIIEGTVCVPGTIPARAMFKRDKNEDFRLGVKSLYSGHTVSSVQVLFDFLVGAHSINVAKELVDILQDKKAVSVPIEKTQKWRISQNCEIVKRFMWQ